MTHYFKDDEKDVVNNSNGELQQRNMYPNSGMNAAAAVAASRHPVRNLLLFFFILSSSNYLYCISLAFDFD